MRQATMDQLGTVFPIFIVGCCLQRKFAKLQGGLVSPCDGPATSQVPQSGVSGGEVQAARGSECSKGEGGVWCAAGGPRKGITTLTDRVYVDMCVSV